MLVIPAPVPPGSGCVELQAVMESNSSTKSEKAARSTQAKLKFELACTLVGNESLLLPVYGAAGMSHALEALSYLELQLSSNDPKAAPSKWSSAVRAQRWSNRGPLCR